MVRNLGSPHRMAEALWYNLADYGMFLIHSASALPEMADSLKMAGNGERAKAIEESRNSSGCYKL